MSTNLSVERAAVDRVSQLLNHEIGLRTEPALRGRLERCIRDDAADGGLDVDSYADTLTGGGSALQNLVNRVTVQETAFFRHPEHFDLLASGILRGLTQPVRIWSAACSNGQEAYSLAMLLEELDIPGSIVASDLSTVALERTIAATYTERELLGLTTQRVGRHLDRREDGYHVKQRVQARVTTLHVNLLDPIPSQFHSCQIVFCRNVLIYLTAEHATRFLDRLADVMPADSHLVVGSAETIWHINARFEPVQLGSSYVYRRRARRSARVVPQLGAMSRAGAAVAAQVGGAHPQAARPAPPARTQSGRRAAVPSAAEVVPVAVQQPAAGERATAAVVASRRWAYSEPDDPIAHFHLATALDESGHPVAARRAFRSALTALDSRAAGPLGDVLEGYDSAELRRLLVAKCRPRDDLPAGPPAAPSNGTPR
jgi:chemotaxis protein methyltransferase CheR